MNVERAWSQVDITWYPWVCKDWPAASRWNFFHLNSWSTSFSDSHLKNTQQVQMLLILYQFTTSNEKQVRPPITTVHNFTHQQIKKNLPFPVHVTDPIPVWSRISSSSISLEFWSYISLAQGPNLTFQTSKQGRCLMKAQSSYSNWRTWTSQQSSSVALLKICICNARALYWARQVRWVPLNELGGNFYDSVYWLREPFPRMPRWKLNSNLGVAGNRHDE